MREKLKLEISEYFKNAITGEACQIDAIKADVDIQKIIDKHSDWIPVSVDLPDEPFACDVTVLDSNPSTMEEYETVLPYHVGYDGEDWNDEEGNTIPFEVIAWKPEPEPYKER